MRLDKGVGRPGRESTDPPVSGESVQVVLARLDPRGVVGRPQGARWARPADHVWPRLVAAGGDAGGNPGYSR